MVLLVALLFDLGVDFDVFLCRNMGFLGQSSCFEVIVLIKLVTMLVAKMEDKYPRVELFRRFWVSLEMQVCGGMCEAEPKSVLAW
jgi:hypothetical protein